MKDEWRVFRVACCMLRVACSVVYVFTYSLFTNYCSLLFTPNPASTANTHLEQTQDCAP
jgi:hypothetical protein